MYQIKGFTQTHYPLRVHPYPVCVPPGNRKRLSLIQMIQLRQLKAGVEKRGFTGSAGLFSGDGTLTSVALHFAATLMPQGRRLTVQ